MATTVFAHYGQSKLCNLLFTPRCWRKNFALAAAVVTINAVHPASLPRISWSTARTTAFRWVAVLMRLFFSHLRTGRRNQRLSRL
jgi:NAD(P)-dependent dehydrogenase (short-subunit alcohol dehydrogenase family)